MKHHNPKTVALLAALFIIALPAPAALAQSEDGRSAAEMVTDYLEQDIFLRPGVGLKKVKIGMTFEQVQEAWGAPSHESRHKVTSRKWTYELADHTRIVLQGGETVQMMAVQGGFSSPYTTSEGASFGMAGHQLATIYGARQPKDGVVRYAERGIGFSLDQGQVREIRVFPPD